jgi:replicative DNA helicase
MHYESNSGLLGDVTSAEYAIVGGALHKPDILDEVDLSPLDFANLGLGRIYRLIGEMVSEGAPVDAATVAARVPAFAAEGIRGITAVDVLQLWSSAPSYVHAYSYAKIIREKAIRRRLLAAAERMAQMARMEGDIEEIVENARADVDASSRSVVRQWDMAEEFDAYVAQIGQEQVMYPTMWPLLNAAIGGYRPGELYVLGARPGVGKSIFGIQAAIDLAPHGTVCLHSLEMPTRQVFTRLAANIARVDTRRLDGSGGGMRAEDWIAVREHAATVRAMPLSIDDRSSVTVNQIRSHVRTQERKGKVAGLIVDYLGLIEGSRPNMSTYERVSENTRLLKGISKEFDIPVILQAQLNRGVEQRSSAIPNLSDLRDSGEIEQHGGVIAFLYDSEEEGYGMFLAKNRHGPNHVNIPLVRRGQFSRLDNVAFEQPPLVAES